MDALRQGGSLKSRTYGRQGLVVRADEFLGAILKPPVVRDESEDVDLLVGFPALLGDAEFGDR